MLEKINNFKKTCCATDKPLQMIKTIIYFTCSFTQTHNSNTVMDLNIAADKEKVETKILAAD